MNGYLKLISYGAADNVNKLLDAADWLLGLGREPTEVYPLVDEAEGILETVSKYIKSNTYGGRIEAIRAL